MNLKKKLFLCVCAAAIIGLSLLLYTFFPFYLLVFTKEQDFEFQNNSQSILVLSITAFLYWIYQAVLIIKSKKKTSIQVLFEDIEARKLSPTGKTIFLYGLVKLFFIPLMLPASVFYFKEVYELLNSSFSGSKIVDLNFVQLFNTVLLFPLIVYLITAVALGIYSFGYLFQSDYLKSKVQSVDQTWLGWLVVLICYAPFFTIVTQVIPFPTQDFAFFLNENLTFAVRIGIAVFLVLKLYAIVNMGFKCSNLTNRGIVTRGAYRWVRHPHYLTKLVVWWVTFIPYLIRHYWAFGFMLFWTVIYILRAFTEEIHLSKDVAYVDYKRKVKWMFIPYLL